MSRDEWGRLVEHSRGIQQCDFSNANNYNGYRNYIDVFSVRQA